MQQNSTQVAVVKSLCRNTAVTQRSGVVYLLLLFTQPAHIPKRPIRSQSPTSAKPGTNPQTEELV